jgi:putative NADH-flavin reductase
MKLAIFGGTGNTGKLLVEQALDAGNQVVAYVRDPTKLDIKSDRLAIIQGELVDEEKIESALKGAGAVLSALGPKGGSKGKPLTRGMQVIIAAMKRQGVRRLIVTSTLSAKDPHDLPEFRARVLVALVRLAMRGAYEEILSVADTVRESDQDWTIVRLTMLNNKPKSGKVRAGYLGKSEVGTWISRADVADFMLQQVQDAKYLRQAPAISN